MYGGPRLNMSMYICITVNAILSTACITGIYNTVDISRCVLIGYKQTERFVLIRASNLKPAFVYI